MLVRIVDAGSLRCESRQRVSNSPQERLTGTGLVPPDDYTLEPGHTVEIEIEGIGVLVNTVVT